MSEIKTNKLSSLTGTNNDITIDPDGTGKTVVASELKYNTLINAEAAGNGAFTGTAGDILDSIATTYGQYAGFAQNLYYSDGWKYATNGYGAMHQLNGSGSWVFYTAPNNTSGHAAAASNVERMRLTAGGNLHIGKTADGIATAGLSLRGDADVAQFTRNGGEALDLNRLSSDGNIVGFYKDSTLVGSIGADSGDLTIDGGASHTGLRFVSSYIQPRLNGSLSNGGVDLGTGSARFDDIFAVNGTIQTSDQNEKQQIASLTSAEITAAKAISKLFKTFKWNDSVTENGDNARTHTGVIAQQVETAMTDAGLDAGDYAFFISSTWWETQTDVPAVSAVAEVLNEDGNVVTEAVEAVAAYTRTDTYDTQAEAPAGATERTRKGIRYPELLAFVGAATEQRLADIETRLTALENA